MIWLIDLVIYWSILIYWFIVEAKCDEVSLLQLVEDIGSSINETEENIAELLKAKRNVREAIDCQSSQDPNEKKIFFEHYEELCRTITILDSVVTDLKIKKDVVAAEKERCEKRSM